MVRRLDMDKTQGIEQLFATGMSRRQIAMTLGVNRKFVDRHLATLESKGAKALTGSGDSISVPQAPKEEGSTAAQSRSECARYREQIIAKV